MLRWYMREKYSPRMPRLNNCAPEKMVVTEVMKVNPGTAPPLIS